MGERYLGRTPLDPGTPEPGSSERRNANIFFDPKKLGVRCGMGECNHHMDGNCAVREAIDRLWDQYLHPDVFYARLAELVDGAVKERCVEAKDLCATEDKWRWNDTYTRDYNEMCRIMNAEYEQRRKAQAQMRETKKRRRPGRKSSGPEIQLQGQATGARPGSSRRGR